MTTMGPYNYQNIFESDVWNVFEALGLGYFCYLVRPSNGQTIELLPPKDSKYASFTEDVKIIDELNIMGLAEETTEIPLKYPEFAEKAYKLTETGRTLYVDLAGSGSAQKDFVERVRPRKHYV